LLVDYLVLRKQIASEIERHKDDRLDTEELTSRVLDRIGRRKLTPEQIKSLYKIIALGIVRDEQRKQSLFPAMESSAQMNLDNFPAALEVFIGAGLTCGVLNDITSGYTLKEISDRRNINVRTLQRKLKKLQSTVS
jgi:AraC-like DNA-binding protein